MDCIAGSGVLSELHIGIGMGQVTEMLAKPDLNEKLWQEREYRNTQDIGSLSMVGIKNFASRLGKEEVSNALADWVADFVSGHVCTFVHHTMLHNL